MALATRCPDCQSTFRVVADQLKLRGGLVRCGACRHVFDAIASLSYVDDQVIAGHDAPAATAATTAPARSATTAASAQASADPPGAPSLRRRTAPGERFDAAEAPARPDPPRAEVASVPAPAPRAATVSEPARTPDGHATEGRAIEGRATEGRAPEGQATEERGPEERALDERAPEGRKAEGRAPEGRALEGRALEGRALEGRAIEGRALEGRKTEGRAPEGRAPEGRTLEGRAPDVQAVENFAIGSEGTEGRPTEGRGTDRQELAPRTASGSAGAVEPEAESLAPPAAQDAASDVATDFAASRDDDGQGTGSAATLPATAPAVPGGPRRRRRRRSEDADNALDAGETPAFLRQQGASRFSVVFGGGSAVLGLLLLMQLAVVMRTDLVTRWPTVRPALISLCGLFRCTVGWPTRAELLAVVGTELQAIPGTDVLELTAVVRNRAAFRLALPAIEVTLTDTQNRTIARKVFAPVDYVAASGEPSSRIDEGMDAGGDYTVRIAFEARGVTAVGFNVYPFYL